MELIRESSRTPVIKLKFLFIFKQTPLVIGGCVIPSVSVLAIVAKLFLEVFSKVFFIVCFEFPKC